MTSIACRLALPRSPGRTAGTASCEPDRAADVDERQPARRRLDALPPTGSRSFYHADHARPPRARRRTVRCPAGRRRGPGPGSSSARRRPTPAAPTPPRAYPPRQGRSGDVNRPQRAGEHSCCSVEIQSPSASAARQKSPGAEGRGRARRARHRSRTHRFRGPSRFAAHPNPVALTVAAARIRPTSSADPAYPYGSGPPASRSS